MHAMSPPPLDPRESCWAVFNVRCATAWGKYLGGGTRLQLLADLADATSKLNDCLDACPKPTPSSGA